MNFIEYIINVMFFCSILMFLGIPILLLIFLIFWILSLFSIKYLAIIPTVFTVIFIASVFWASKKAAMYRVYDGMTIWDSTELSITELKAIIKVNLRFFKI